MNQVGFAFEMRSGVTFHNCVQLFDAIFRPKAGLNGNDSGWQRECHAYIIY
jgi:hypothetical protein